ncbi:hypothetical protein EV715DRAFT_297452 [Schizophyllum commune]
MALATSAFISAPLWLIGALAFWYSAPAVDVLHPLYFAYATLIAVGYGDFYPQPSSGKPFFVFWTLLAVPNMAVLISNMGDTILVTRVKEGVLWPADKMLVPGNENRSGNRSEGDPRAHATRGDEEGLMRSIEKLGEVVEKGRGAS